MRFNVRIEVDASTGMWAAYVPALGDLSTFGDSREAVLARVQRAIEGYLESAAEAGLMVPKGGDRAEWTEVNVGAPAW